ANTLETKFERVSREYAGRSARVTSFGFLFGHSIVHFDAQMICCGAQQGGLVKAKLIITAVALLALGASARTPAQSSETLLDKKAKGPYWTPEKQIQDAEVLELLEKEKAGKFPPGTSWSYSNSGYVVLGLIVAKVSGKSYDDFLHTRIFAPLKMNHTMVFQKGKNRVANRALGHSKDGTAFKETDQSPTSATLGDGGIY